MVVFFELFFCENLSRPPRFPIFLNSGSKKREEEYGIVLLIYETKVLYSKCFLPHLMQIWEKESSLPRRYLSMNKTKNLTLPSLRTNNRNLLEKAKAARHDLFGLTHI